MKDIEKRIPRDVTELAKTIQELALLVGMRFVVNNQKVKVFNATICKDHKPESAT
jgi:hypothetical protein